MKVLQFLILTHKRLSAKSPEYFQIVKFIGVAAGVIIGMPEFLELFSIEVPKVLAPIYSKVISISGFVAAFIAALTVEDSGKL